MKVNGSGQATTLSPQQLDAILDAAPSPAMRCLWAVQRYTASRVTETTLLSWAAVSNDRLVFIRKDTKTKASREVLLHPDLQAEIDRYRQWWTDRHGHTPRPRDLLFPGRFSAKEAITRQAVDLALRKALADLDLPAGISTHTWRRSFCTNAVQKGASFPTVMRYTGHKNLAQLQKYVDVPAQDERDLLSFI